MTDPIHAIPSLPGKRASQRRPPTTAAIAPRMIVATTLMFCRPGISSRASAPITQSRDHIHDDIHDRDVDFSSEHPFLLSDRSSVGLRALPTEGSSERCPPRLGANLP